MFTHTEFAAAPTQEEYADYRTQSRESSLSGANRMLELLASTFPNLPAGTAWQAKSVQCGSESCTELRFCYEADNAEHEAANAWIETHYPRRWTDAHAPLPEFRTPTARVTRLAAA